MFVPDQVTSDPRPNSAPGLFMPVWPAMALMAGAGAAYLWWTHWGRMLAPPSPTQAAEPTASESAVPPAASTQPVRTETRTPVSAEQIIAHMAPPAALEHASVDPSDARLVEPAADLMAHASPAPKAEAENSGDASLSEPAEEIMAHSPPPPSFAHEAVDPSDAQLVEPAAELMAHTPPETVGVAVETNGEIVPLQALPASPPDGSDPTAAETQPAFQQEMRRPASDASARFGGDVSIIALTGAELLAVSDAAPPFPADAALPASAADVVGETLGVQGAEPAPAIKPRSRRKPSSGPSSS